MVYAIIKWSLHNRLIVILGVLALIGAGTLYVGRRARVRTRGEHEGRRSFTGELLNATEDEVTVAADTGVVSIAYADIHRSNLVGD